MKFLAEGGVGVSIGEKFFEEEAIAREMAQEKKREDMKSDIDMFEPQAKVKESKKSSAKKV